MQIRGTEPRLSNVTVNGVHIPGTQAGSRITKLDDVPTDILGAIEVSKTLTADQDADAIGGSVNLVTKTPEGAPRGYIAGQFGQSTLESRSQSQGSAMWGGRFGEQRKLGVLLGGTWDHNNRGINDIELAWDANAKGTPIPVEWDQRDYLYDRTRWGANGALDYRFDDGSSMFLRGAWSKFKNFGVVYKYDIAADGDSAQASSGAAGIGTGATLTRNTSNRTPCEQLFSVNGGGKKQLGGVEVNYMASYCGHALDVGRRQLERVHVQRPELPVRRQQSRLPDVLVPVERRPGDGERRRRTTSSRRRRSAPARRRATRSADSSTRSSATRSAATTRSSRSA